METIVYVIGLGLQLIGIGMALWGVQGLSAELFPGSPLPYEAVRLQVRRVLRRRPVSTTLEVDGMTSQMHLTDNVELEQGRVLPVDGAWSAEWIDYLESSLRVRDLRLERLSTSVREADDHLRTLITEEVTAREIAVAGLQQRLHTIVGGEGGKGLRNAWWGLVLGFVGTCLTGFAGMP